MSMKLCKGQLTVAHVTVLPDHLNDSEVEGAHFKCVGYTGRSLFTYASYPDSGS